MNMVDLAIVGIIGLMALMGLRSGFLVPASGIGGLVLGVVIALQFHGELAGALVEYIEGEVVRRVVAFAAIVLGTTVAARVTASLVRRSLSYLQLGWIDRAAGGVAAAGIGFVVVGTVVYVLSGLNVGGMQAAFDESALVAPISQASLISADAPWYPRLQAAPNIASGEVAAALEGTISDGPEECVDLQSLATKLLGGTISEKLSGLLG